LERSLPIKIKITRGFHTSILAFGLFCKGFSYMEGSFGCIKIINLK
jgi:hypothetical protein